MNERVKGLLTTIGALAEVCAEFKCRLQEKGFSGSEAAMLVNTLLRGLVEE